jgi:hypothetical protein
MLCLFFLELKCLSVCLSIPIGRSNPKRCAAGDGCARSYNLPCEESLAGKFFLLVYTSTKLVLQKTMHLEEWRSGEWGRRLPGSMGSYNVHGFDLNLQNVVKAKFCPSVTLKFKNPMSVSDRYMCKTLTFYFLFALCHRSTGWLSIFQTLFQMVSLSMPIFIGRADCLIFFPLSPLHHLLGFILGNWSHWGYWVYTFWFPGGTSEKKKNPADLFPSLDATS